VESHAKRVGPSRVCPSPVFPPSRDGWAPEDWKNRESPGVGPPLFGVWGPRDSKGWGRENAHTPGVGPKRMEKNPAPPNDFFPFFCPLSPAQVARPSFGASKAPPCFFFGNLHFSPPVERIPTSIFRAGSHNQKSARHIDDFSWAIPTCPLVPPYNYIALRLQQPFGGRFPPPPNCFPGGGARPPDVAPDMRPFAPLAPPRKSGRYQPAARQWALPLAQRLSRVGPQVLPRGGAAITGRPPPPPPSRSLCPDVRIPARAVPLPPR